MQLPKFLLVINTNLPPILHSLRDMAFNRSKIHIFGYPGVHPLRSLVTSVLSHFGPKTDLHVHFGRQPLRSSVTSVLGTEVTEPDRSLAKSDRSSPKGGNPQFSAHFYCGKTAGFMKMPLGTEVGLSPGDFV